MPGLRKGSRRLLGLMGIHDTEDLKKNLFKLYLFYGGKQDFVTLACICLGYGRKTHQSSACKPVQTLSRSSLIGRDALPTKENLSKKIKQMNARLMKEGIKLQLTCQIGRA